MSLSGGYPIIGQMNAGGKVGGGEQLAFGIYLAKLVNSKKSMFR